jgi:hemolysin III
MDFIPIALLAAFAAIYYWLQVIPNKIWATLAFVSVLSTGFLVRQAFDFPRPVAISMGYISLALGILIPLVLFCRRSAWRHFSLIGFSILSFAAAISFRILDRDLSAYFPMGTHFLWHLLGGTSTFLLLLYAFRTDVERE